MPDEALEEVGINAECYSDDHVHEVEFNAAPFFVAAEDDEIIALAEADWGGDYAADEVAIYMEKRHPGVEKLFKYLRDMSDRRDAPGFEVYVNDEDAIDWLRVYRPHLLEHPHIARWVE